MTTTAVPLTRPEVRHGSARPEGRPAPRLVPQWARAAWWVPATLGTVALSAHHAGFTHPDVGLARAAGRQLLTTHALTVFRANPRAQMGAGALLASLLPHLLYNILVAATLGVFLVLAVPAARQATRRGWLLAQAGAALLVVPWAQLAWKGHLDDALVLIGAVGVCAAVRSGRIRAASVWLAVALLGKPTAAVLIPLLALAGPAGAVGAAMAVAVTWGPFVLVDADGLLHAGRGVMTVAPGSLPALLGEPLGSIPGWIRPAELVAGLALAAVGVRRRAPLLGLLAGFAVRALLEPNPAPAYSITLTALALAVDLNAGRLLLTPLAWVGFWVSDVVLAGGPGWARVVCLSALLAVCAVSLRRSGTEPEPRSGVQPVDEPARVASCRSCGALAGPPVADEGVTGAPAAGAVT